MCSSLYIDIIVIVIIIVIMIIIIFIIIIIIMLGIVQHYFILLNTMTSGSTTGDSLRAIPVVTCGTTLASLASASVLRQPVGTLGR